MKARRALMRLVMLVLFAAGCFGLGLAVARWAGWGPAGGPAAPSMGGPSGVAGSAVPTGVAGSGAPAPGSEPRIYIDAGAIELHDASLTIQPLEPPRRPRE